ncbi:hypothetical protein IFU39_16615 [Paenibacillus sp. CFBP 13594]|uniref:hypothetical protein n=1 Tax=Paenibacillus sp. CFBP 13594 TaxID=2774037 RepID=UPI0017830029|nr:hypothetical protein [Paenibacillus sp. CFBP 13594]MBD8839437.1 hypothetical protein [Paenibacillus sp. CFBP 13594]
MNDFKETIEQFETKKEQYYKKENANEAIKQSLVNALIKFTDNKLTLDKAIEVADVIISKVDFSDPVLSHKGINWFVKDFLKNFRIVHEVKMKTQMASTPTLEGEDAKRLLDSLQIKPTERSKENAMRLKEYFEGIEKKPTYRLEQSLIEMNDIRTGRSKGKSWEHLKKELNTLVAKERSQNNV